jgi:signal peptidase I
LNARRGLLFFGAAGALFISTRWLRGRVLPVEVAGTSMTPELQPGDYLLVWRSSMPRDAAGLIAYLRGPDGRPLLKRVVGLPGESVRAGARVEVNGRMLDEPYAGGGANPEQYRAVHRLDEGQYFVLGDARAASTDSRDFGPVSGSDIEGIAWLRYWPASRCGRIRRPKRAFAAPRTVSEG